MLVEPGNLVSQYRSIGRGCLVGIAKRVGLAKQTVGNARLRVLHPEDEPQVFLGLMDTVDHMTLSYSDQLATEGYTVIPGLIEPHVISDVCEFIRDEGGLSAGTRRLIDRPWCAALAGRIAKDERVRALIPADAVAAQCTLFSKNLDTNWLVPLHQDLSIPVAERVDSDRCSGWSEKEGELFVQPPVDALAQLLAVRLHLDDCDDLNGALRVVPGSHLLGRLNSTEAQGERDRRGSILVSVPRGGAMLMRPLLLHTSSKARVDSPRRVLHFVFGPRLLPDGLRWA